MEENFKGTKYNHLGNFTKEFRRHIYIYCLEKCWYCALPLKEMDHSNPPQIDHIKPKAEGGTNEEWNLVLACRSCNCKKGARYFFNYIKNPVMCFGKNIFNEEGLIINF